MLQQCLPNETRIMRGLKDLEEDHGQATKDVELRVEAVVLAVLGGKVSVAEADPLSAISGVEGAFDLVVMATHGRRLKRVGDVRACRGLVP